MKKKSRHVNHSVHRHHHPVNEKNLLVATLLNLVITVAEFAGGLVSNSLALISESWLFTSEDVDVKEFPFGVALRFFGERISIDFGVLLIGEALEEGFPIPWLSAAYSFGRRQ